MTDWTALIKKRLDKDFEYWVDEDGVQQLTINNQKTKDLVLMNIKNLLEEREVLRSQLRVISGVHGFLPVPEESRDRAKGALAWVPQDSEGVPKK